MHKLWRHRRANDTAGYGGVQTISVNRQHPNFSFGGIDLPCSYRLASWAVSGVEKEGEQDLGWTVMWTVLLYWEKETWRGGNMIRPIIEVSTVRRKKTAFPVCVCVFFIRCLRHFPDSASAFSPRLRTRMPWVWCLVCTVQNRHHPRKRRLAEVN